jgi:hypothetical protein
VRKRLILAGLLLMVMVGVLVVRQVIRNRGLYLVSSSPKNNGIVGSVDSLTFTFNRDLDDLTVKQFKLEPSVDGRVELKGKTLVFHPTSSYKFGDTYTALIENPRSRDGHATRDVRIRFKVGFVEKPTKEQNQQALERTDSLQRQYPLLAHIPHETLNYKIDYRFQALEEDREGIESEQVLVIRIELYAVLNRPDQRESYRADLKKYKEEALEYIRSKGEDPAKYRIEYSPSEAATL